MRYVLEPVQLKKEIENLFKIRDRHELIQQKLFADGYANLNKILSQKNIEYLDKMIIACGGHTILARNDAIASRKNLETLEEMDNSFRQLKAVIETTRESFTKTAKSKDKSKAESKVKSDDSPPTPTLAKDKKEEEVISTTPETQPKAPRATSSFGRLRSIFRSSRSKLKPEENKESKAESKDPSTALLVALRAAKPDFDLVQKLIKQGASACLVGGEKNQTALHMLISFSQSPTAGMVSVTKLIKQLIENTPKEHLNQKDRDGNTPLHIAFYRDNNEAMLDLLEAGADPTIANSEGTPIQLLRPEIAARIKAGDPCEMETRILQKMEAFETLSQSQPKPPLTSSSSVFVRPITVSKPRPPSEPRKVMPPTSDAPAPTKTSTGTQSK